MTLKHFALCLGSLASPPARGLTMDSIYNRVFTRTNERCSKENELVGKGICWRSSQDQKLYIYVPDDESDVDSGNGKARSKVDRGNWDQYDDESGVYSDQDIGYWDTSSRDNRVYSFSDVVAASPKTKDPRKDSSKTKPKTREIGVQTEGESAIPEKHQTTVRERSKITDEIYRNIRNNENAKSSKNWERVKSVVEQPTSKISTLSRKLVDQIKNAPKDQVKSTTGVQAGFKPVTEVKTQNTAVDQRRSNLVSNRLFEQVKGRSTNGMKSHQTVNLPPKTSFGGSTATDENPAARISSIQNKPGSWLSRNPGFPPSRPANAPQKSNTQSDSKSFTNSRIVTAVSQPVSKNQARPVMTSGDIKTQPYGAGYQMVQPLVKKCPGGRCQRNVLQRPDQAVVANCPQGGCGWYQQVACPSGGCPIAAR